MNELKTSGSDEQMLMSQLSTSLELYCNDTGTSLRELFEQRFSVVDILNDLRSHQGNDFIVAFAPVSALETSVAWKLLMKARLQYQAKGALPQKSQSGSHQHWIQCNYKSRTLFPEGNHECGYWMRADAEHCLSCGHKLHGDSPHWTEVVPRAAGAAMIAISLLVLLLHFPQPISFRWIGTFIGSSIFLALAIFMGIAQKLGAKHKATELAKRPPETLMSAQLNLRKKRNKLLQGIEKASGLLTAGDISGDEIELLRKANERRQRQLVRVESEIKKIEFLRWQNQVERMLDAIHEDFDPANLEYQPANRVESHLKRLADEGKKLKDTWTESEPFGIEAQERITALMSTCEAGQKLVRRRQVLETLRDASVDEGEAHSSVLADVELRGEMTEAITLKVEIAAPDFLHAELALEAMRLEALNELDARDSDIVKSQPKLRVNR